MFLTVPQLFAWSGDVVVATPNTAMVLHADEGKDLRMDYYGAKGFTLQQLRDAGDVQGDRKRDVPK